MTHGKSGYVQGCRCEVCRTEYAAYKRAWRAQNGPAAQREKTMSRLRKQQQRGVCEDCGATTSGTSGGISRTPRWCSECGRRHSGETSKALSAPIKEQVKALWVAGYSIKEIAGVMGWTPGSTSKYISGQRARNGGFPYRNRMTPAGLAAISVGARKARAREAAAKAQAA